MNFQSRTNKQKTSRWVFFTVGVVLVVSAATAADSALRYITGANQSIVSQSWVNIKALIADKRVLIERNQSLEESLQETLLVRAISDAQHERYQRILNEQFALDTDLVIASVISRPPYSPYDTYMISSDQSGIVSSQLAIQHRDYVAGYVTQYQDGVGQIKLLSYPGFDFVVSIDGVLYPAQGQGGGVVSVRLPRNFVDTQGQVVRVPGAEGYVLGTVTTTEFDPQDSYVKGIVSLPHNIFEQEFVTISRQKWINILDIDTTVYEEESDTQ